MRDDAWCAGHLSRTHNRRWSGEPGERERGVEGEREGVEEVQGETGSTASPNRQRMNGQAEGETNIKTD